MHTFLDEEEQRFRELCVDLVSSLSRMPIGLYVEGRTGEGQLTISPQSRWQFEGFCQYMHRDPVRRTLCDADHERRAQATTREVTTLCHAGLFNCAVPFTVGQRKIVLMGGEMRIEGQEAESDKRFQEFAQRMKLTDHDRAELLRRLHSAKKLHPDEVEIRLLAQLRLIGRWYAQYLAMRRSFEESIGNVAHEFLIHVTALHATCDLLCQDMESISPMRREIKEEARELLHNIDRLQDVVHNHLVGYQEEPRFERRTIGPIIHEAVEVYSSQAKEKGVRFEVNVELVNNRSPEIEMAPGHLRRAMHNLVQNAVKYSYSGLADRERVVRVSGRVLPDGYLITVENFGIGIDEDEYDKIWQRGYQRRRTRSEYRPGSGNGLYIVRQIVEMHRGRISVKSFDKGSAFLTRFDVWLPYQQAVAG